MLTEDRERLRYLRALLVESGVDWDLAGDPPEIAKSAQHRSLLRRAIAEIRRDFPVTLAAISAGKDTAPGPPEYEAEFYKRVQALSELGVCFDGTDDPPNLAEIAFDPPEQRELAEAFAACGN